MSEPTTTTPPTLRLYGVTDDGRLKVDLAKVTKNRSMTQARHESLRLPPECGVVFGDTGQTLVAELTDEERAWIESESSADFGVYA